MFDRNNNIWVSECDEKQLARKVADSEDPASQEIRFLRASLMLSKIREDESFVATAVAETERLAEEKYPPALYAMAQMFEFGWGVAKDEELCLLWYKRAGMAGYRPKDGYMDFADSREAVPQEKKQKKSSVKIAAIIAACVIAVAGVAGIVIAAVGTAGELVIRVNKNTELTETVDATEFSKEVGELLAEYDTPQMISGEVSTNRVILKFDGNKLDLRDFLADKVVYRENGLVVIQFRDEKEAQKCIDALKNNEKVIYVETDMYSDGNENIPEEYCSLNPVKSVEPCDEYYSWGVRDMGLDKLSEYVSENFSANEVIVGIIDSGALIHSENAHRYLNGINLADGGDVFPEEHGTHVTGIVLDGARCDNIKIVNLDVYGSNQTFSYLTTANAYYCAAEIGVDVINMSQGFPCSELIHDAIKETVEKGIVVVTSAGNDSWNLDKTKKCPKHIENIIVVGAYDIRHEMAYFTNYGHNVSVSAPGVDIYSYSHIQDGYLVNLQGTSMAAPHVTALAALIRAINPDMTPDEVKYSICKYTRAFTNSGAYSTGLYGTGAPDATAFIESY